KRKKAKGPAQLSKYFNKDSDASDSSDSGKGPRSAISGKRIKLKLNRNKEEKEMDKKRKEVLEFYNQMYT
ncbi:uncharacterized protein ACA1_096040, partial [Acanthamoeba castellanii str. Neff]